MPGWVDELELITAQQALLTRLKRWSRSSVSVTSMPVCSGCPPLVRGRSQVAQHGTGDRAPLYRSILIRISSTRCCKNDRFEITEIGTCCAS